MPDQEAQQNMRRKTSIWLSLLVLITLAVTPFATAASRVVWQIGKFDLSSADLHQSTPGPPLFSFGYPQRPVVYVIGRSTPGKDWPAFQPGSANAAAGEHPHPYTIQFDLPHPGRGLYTLKIGMRVQTKRLSTLQISLNGHRGWAYQRPVWVNIPGRKHWSDLIRVALPNSFLIAGTNKLVLTAIDEPAGRDDVSNTGIVYDALALDDDSTRKFQPSAISANITPTVFYRRTAASLTEQIDILVHQNRRIAQGGVKVTVNGRRAGGPLASNIEFGEQLILLNVPEFPAPTTAQLTVTSGHHSYHFSEVITPAKKWTLFAVPHEHLDIGFTDYQSKVAQLHSRVVDEVMHLIALHPDFVYSPDGYWVIQQFMAGSKQQNRERLRQLVRSKRFFVPAQYANLLTGFPTVETLIESLYPAFRFDQTSGEDFDYANITDVPSYSWSYASVLADAGIKYFLAGCDQIRGPILSLSHLQEQSPFWWEGPDGQKVLMWYSNGYGQIGDLFGLPPQILTGVDSVPRFLQTYPPAEYKPDVMLLFGAQYENSDFYSQNAAIADAWNNIYAYPRLRYSGFAQALAAIQHQDHSPIPVIRGDGGPYWEDGIASDARYAAMNRETEQRTLSAEKLSTLASMINSSASPPEHTLELLWHDVTLFDEHTWGAFASISAPKIDESKEQLAVKDAFATRAHDEMQYVLDRAVAAISNEIQEPANTWIVFNPLNWQRDGWVEIDVPKGSELVDLATHQPVSYEVLFTSGSYDHVRFIAKDVPPLGYRCYTEEKAGAKTPSPTTVSSPSEIIQNAYYNVDLDPSTGAIRSIFDKQLQKQLVNPSSPYRFGQYIYVSGGDQPPRNRLLDFDNNFSAPLPALVEHGAAGGHLISISREPFGTVARMESSALNTPRIVTKVVLFDSEKKIEITYHIQKRPIYAKEAVYIAFPFSIPQPDFRYDIQNGYVDPAKDQLPGAGKEWFSVQHWVEARGSDIDAAIVPLDAPLVTLGDIWRGTWPLDFGKRLANIFSYAMNNYWWTNYRAAQGGDFTFRYVITSGADLTPEQLTCLGWEEMTPLEVDDIVPNDKAANPPAPFRSPAGSFMQINQPNIVLVTWKRAEDHNGTILRLLETAGRQDTVRITIPWLSIEHAWLCNAVEENEGAVEPSAHSLQFPVRPFQIITVRIEGTSAPEDSRSFGG
jgi:alpha-mannosidase